jgi:hypothetical protein
MCPEVNQVNWANSSASNLYLEDDWFEYQLGYSLSWLRFILVSVNPHRQIKSLEIGQCLSSSVFIKSLYHLISYAI